MLTLRDICVIKDNELVDIECWCSDQRDQLYCRQNPSDQNRCSTDRWIALRANPRLVKISIADQRVDKTTSCCTNNLFKVGDVRWCLVHYHLGKGVKCME